VKRENVQNGLSEIAIDVFPEDVDKTREGLQFLRSILTNADLLDIDLTYHGIKINADGSISFDMISLKIEDLVIDSNNSVVSNYLSIYQLLRREYESQSIILRDAELTTPISRFLKYIPSSLQSLLRFIPKINEIIQGTPLNIAAETVQFQMRNNSEGDNTVLYVSLLNANIDLADSAEG
jgi:hypothetical protein